MLSRIKKFIRNCKECQQNKIVPSTKLPMVLTTTSTKPFDRIFLDVVGPLPISYKNHKYILTMQDDLSKFSVAVPMQNQEAKTIAHAFVEHLILRFGAPKSILTDQGSNFLSEIFTNICKLLNIKKLNSTAYHPQTNGALERSHRGLVEYLRTYVNGNSQDWDSWVPFAMFSYNSTPHSTTRFIPFELIHGFTPNLPTSLKQQSTNAKPIYNYDDYIIELKTKLKNCHELAKANAKLCKIKSKEYYDKNAKNLNFEPGDWVYLKNEHKNSKLDSPWLGPYKIVEKLSQENSKIKIKQKHRIVHNNRLKVRMNE